MRTTQVASRVLDNYRQGCRRIFRVIGWSTILFHRFRRAFQRSSSTTAWQQACPGQTPMRSGPLSNAAFPEPTGLLRFRQSAYPQTGGRRWSWSTSVVAACAGGPSTISSSYGTVVGSLYAASKSALARFRTSEWSRLTSACLLSGRERLRRRELSLT